MVDEAQGRRIAGGERHVERLDRQACFEMIGERPTDHLAREGVEDDRQIDEVLGQTHVGDVGDPDLVEAGGFEAARQVRRDLKPMRLIVVSGRTDGAFSQQIVLAVSVQHPLHVEEKPLTLELMGDASPRR